VVPSIIRSAEVAVDDRLHRAIEIAATCKPCEESMTCQQSRTNPNTAPGNPCAWAADGTGVQPGGDAGGDIQAGESYRVRYRRADRPCAMITRTAYPAEVPGQPGVFFVQVETEWLVSTDPLDPGGTETWSDYAYDDEPGIYASAAEAEKAAVRVATALLADGCSHNWPGFAPE
jgi:hypothetical protein